MNAALTPEPAGNLQFFAQKLDGARIRSPEWWGSSGRGAHDVSLDRGAHALDRPERRLPRPADANTHHLPRVDLDGDTPTHFGEQRDRAHRRMLPVDGVTHGTNRRRTPALMLRQPRGTVHGSERDVVDRKSVV